MKLLRRHQHEIALADDFDDATFRDQLLGSAMLGALILALREPEILIADHKDRGAFGDAVVDVGADGITV